MATATQEVRAMATRAAAQRLARAASFAELHSRKPLFQRTMKHPGGRAVLVRIDWPGILRVFDPATGELLAESEAGAPGRVRAGFVPGVPAGTT